MSYAGDDWDDRQSQTCAPSPWNRRDHSANAGASFSDPIRINHEPGNAIKMTSSIPAPGQATLRKHPLVVGNRNGQILLAWTEGMAWQKGGSLGWQVFDAAGRAQGEAMHASDDVIARRHG